LRKLEKIEKIRHVRFIVIKRREKRKIMSVTQTVATFTVPPYKFTRHL